METTTDPMCDYCGDNPAEPNMPCCSNSRCVRDFYRDCEDAVVG
jgi:hypothetical protein